MLIARDSPDTTGIEVKASAALELMWIFHSCGAEHELSGKIASLDRTRVELGNAVQSFWGDGVRGFTEIVVLAQRSRTLLNLDVDALFGRLEEAIMKTDTPSLLAEPPDERQAVVKRLERLRTDSDLRARYQTLIRAGWESVRLEWESTGRPAVTLAVGDWNRRLADHTGFRELLERPSLWPTRPDLDKLADAAAADGRLVLSPGWYFGDIHVVELNGIVYLGRSVRPKDEDDTRRHVAADVAGNLKVLADPTRLAILMWLARRPSSITEVARHFCLSQPTVSAHVQLLRRAGVLEEKSVGRGSKLTASEESLSRLFEGAQETLLKEFRK